MNVFPTPDSAVTSSTVNGAYRDQLRKGFANLPYDGDDEGIG
jgi:hypothetical protein